MSRRPELLRWFIGGLLVVFLFYNLVSNGFAYSPSESGNAPSLDEFETAQAVSNSTIDDESDALSSMILAIYDDVHSILALLEQRESQGDEVSAVLNEYYLALENLQQEQQPEEQQVQSDENPVEVAEVSDEPFDDQEEEIQEDGSLSSVEDENPVSLETIHNDLIFLSVSVWALGAIWFAFKLGGTVLGK